MSYFIHLVDDEPNLNQVLTSYLQKEGWQIRSFTCGEEARKAIGLRPHLWILDIMLPDVGGYQLIKEIKTDCAQIPVIFISARDADLDRVIGLELGSDDYMPKPFLPRELIIRARNLLERVYGKQQQPSSRFISLPPYTVDPDQRQLRHHEEAIELTSLELDLVIFFAAHLGQAFSREHILQQVWGTQYFGSDRVVDDLVRRVRKKLPELRLETLYGFGYRMVKP